MWEDPADFFKTTTSPVVKEIGAGGLWIFWGGAWVVCLLNTHMKQKHHPFSWKSFQRKTLSCSAKLVASGMVTPCGDPRSICESPPSGLTLVKKVVQQQKGAEFVTWPGMSSQLSQLLQHGISVWKQPKGAEFLSGRFHPSGGLCYTSTSTHDLGEYPSFGNDHLGDGQVGAAKKKKHGWLGWLHLLNFFRMLHFKKWSFQLEKNTKQFWVSKQKFET